MAMPGDPDLTGKAKHRKEAGTPKPKKKDDNEKARKEYSMDELMGEGWRDPPKPSKPAETKPKEKKKDKDK